jgi:hypothetical protein
MLSTGARGDLGRQPSPRPKWCALWALRAGRLEAVDERSTEDLRNEDNPPSADALMSSIRNQFPRESEEQHRKRFIEMVRNGDWKIREEIVKGLFAGYLNRAYR